MHPLNPLAYSRYTRSRRSSKAGSVRGNCGRMRVSAEACESVPERAYCTRQGGYRTMPPLPRSTVNALKWGMPTSKFDGSFPVLHPCGGRQRSIALASASKFRFARFAGFAPVAVCSSLHLTRFIIFDRCFHPLPPWFPRWLFLFFYFCIFPF